MLSIVIPTLNEEKYLPFLLESINKQSFKDFEVIVSDAGSKDKTREIAQKYGCKIVKGGLPPFGKNKGAELAQGELVLFIDADTILEDGSLEKILEDFNNKELDIAAFLLKCKGKLYNLSYKFFYNLPCLLSEKFLPQAMSVILVKKEIHQKIKGFNEEVKIGEDLDYVRRGAKIGKFGALSSAKFFVSPRRFKQDGFFITWLKYFLCQLHVILLGPVKTDILKYRFNHYEK